MLQNFQNVWSIGIVVDYWSWDRGFKFSHPPLGTLRKCQRERIIIPVDWTYQD